MLNPGISDYTCEFCRAGEHSLCVNYRLLGEHLPGTAAELLTIPAHNLARVPSLTPELTWAEAAAFSLVTLTAWRMLVTRAQLKSGETALVWGIGGGVSLAAMRVAKLLGARVIVTSSDDAKLAVAKQLGLDDVVAGLLGEVVGDQGRVGLHDRGRLGGHEAHHHVLLDRSRRRSGSASAADEQQRENG